MHIGCCNFRLSHGVANEKKEFANGNRYALADRFCQVCGWLLRYEDQDTAD